LTIAQTSAIRTTRPNKPWYCIFIHLSGLAANAEQCALEPGRLTTVARRQLEYRPKCHNLAGDSPKRNAKGMMDDSQPTAKTQANSS
jgi:hypothetical protein